VPLFFLILWLSHYPAQRLASGTRLVVAAFMIVHGVLHFALASSPLYTFEGSLSNFLIFGAAASGAAYLGTSWSEHRKSDRE
jgi:hypothetical protein